jgi:dihydroneopterin aldolase
MPQDKIIISGISCYGYHGVLPSEQELGQPFIINLELSLSLAAAGRSDDLERTIDYSRVVQEVREIVTGPPCRLIEALAERIAAVLLDHYPAEQVLVRVNKPHAPLGAVCGNVAVEIRRERHG